MNVAVAMDKDVAARIDAALLEKPDGILEMVAGKCEASLWQVFQRLPAGQAVAIASDKFEDLWAGLTTWGTVLFILHTEDIVLECEGALPPGALSHGYFNIHGDSPIGGHIKASNCARIVFVDRAFHGRRSCSVQFLNAAGNAMFKVFVRRDKQRELLTEQVALFEALRAKASVQ
jgi:putative heme utilization carrier protein HutX